MIRDHEIGPVIWSEDIQFPFCDYCLRGQKCGCEAKDQELCVFCEEGCQCGYEEIQRYGPPECTCECTCDDLEEDEEDECNFCFYGCECEAAEVPFQCGCECECEYKCTCRCTCKTLVIEHTSYNRWIEEVSYTCPSHCFDEKHLYFFDEEGNPKIPSIPETNELRCSVKLGPYKYGIKTVPVQTRTLMPQKTLREMMGFPDLVFPEDRKYEWETRNFSAAIYQDNKKGFIRFDGPVHLPILIQPSPYDRKPVVWMSLTPMEVFTLKPSIDFARGNVLIGGLGLGWVTQRALQKHEVSHVTQVDYDANILENFGEPLQEMHPGRIDLVCSNFWDFISDIDLTQFDTIIVDIWANYQNARQDMKFIQLKKAHPNVWGWGFKANIQRKPRISKKTKKKKAKKKRRKRP